MPATDGGTAVSQQQLTAAYGDKADDKLLERTATQLSSTARGAASAGEIRETARAQAAAGVAPSTYAGGYEFAARAAVKEAFDALEAGASVTDARERALDGVSETMADLQQGLEAFDAATVTVNEVIKAVPMSAILIDANHEVIAYTGRLMGLDDDHSEFVGEDCRETIAVATYSDRQRAKTLADKVAAAPHTAHEEWDVERTDGANTLVDFPVYRDRSVSKNKDGVEKHIEFLAVPIFDDGGELKAVLELIEDATEDIQREQDMVSLIEEVSATLGAIGDGDLTARADWEDTNGVIEPGLCDLVEDVNRMAGSFEELINGVDEKTHELEASIDQLGDASDRIDRTVEAQNDSLAEIGTEMENVSATMEEVAANAKEVTEAATRARETVAEGVEAGEKARESTDAVVESTDDLVDTVEQLGERMDEVGEVVDIIADIADQTNILALNANIEAARAETDGDGFAVVADEVKTLASETRDHADEIADRIEEIQRQADDTIDGVERSAEQIAATGDEIRRALDSLAAISDEVENTVDGISEVADANDDQAVRIEEVTATVAEARERADDVAETTDAVVDAVEEQEAAVDDLSDRVAELR
ncbi:methyl-accepting chemotaxis protein [Natronomonas pharaonis]|uniref:methyl-accepting chemotaxis protein n=1 Tax=Natronomonas pharaonis TaxID=2257 RepID=UPI000A5FC7FF|nr:methyl-accepting chemotaxis protein [Natronomonas pharaonis]